MIMIMDSESSEGLGKNGRGSGNKAAIWITWKIRAGGFTLPFSTTFSSHVDYFKASFANYSVSQFRSYAPWDRPSYFEIQPYRLFYLVEQDFGLRLESNRRVFSEIRYVAHITTSRLSLTMPFLTLEII